MLRIRSNASTNNSIALLIHIYFSRMNIKVWFKLSKQKIENTEVFRMKNFFSQNLAKKKIKRIISCKTFHVSNFGVFL